MEMKIKDMVWPNVQNYIIFVKISYCLW
jgi:hypothetical protein